MKLLDFLLRRHKPEPGLSELDEDVKGRTQLYVDGQVMPDRRRDRRPTPKSPGAHAQEPLDDAFPVPFVPPPENWTDPPPKP